MSKALKIGVVAIIVVLAGLVYYEHKMRKTAENELGVDSSRVLSAIFTQQQDLRVATLTGQILTKSKNDGTMFHTEQTSRAPYSVSYFVNLGKIDRGSFFWDAETKTMTVSLDDVVVEPPAIDMQRAEISQDGLWISRSAGIALQRKSAIYLSNAAAAVARSDVNMAKARRAAVDTVSRMVRRPLAAAGLGDVAVRVRFSWEADSPGEPMDRSRSLKEIFGLRR